MTIRARSVGSRPMIRTYDDCLSLFAQHLKEFGLRLIAAIVARNEQRHAAVGVHFRGGVHHRPIKHHVITCNDPCIKISRTSVFIGAL